MVHWFPLFKSKCMNLYADSPLPLRFKLRDMVIVRVIILIHPSPYTPSETRRLKMEMESEEAAR